jgi:hypothetical protein
METCSCTGMLGDPGGYYPLFTGQWSKISLSASTEAPATTIYLYYNYREEKFKHLEI